MEIADRLAESLPARYEPDTLLPTQYYDRIKRRVVLEGERKLMLAVLEDAIECYLNNMRAPSRRRRLLYYAARDWINARGKKGLFAFETLCEALDLDPQALREMLARVSRPHWPGRIADRTRSYRRTGTINRR